MKTAKLFQNGQSQAVRLPKEFRFEGTEVAIKKIDNVVCLIPIDNPWQAMMSALPQFSPDFMKSRHQPSSQKRSTFFS